MRKITSDAYKVMPWKNGQGVTTELLIHPENATLDDFEWRVSSAQVQADGDFSSYKGVDRSLLIVSGEGLVLDVNQQVSLTLTTHSPPLIFAGEDAISARLLGGAVTDFNVMSRRSRWTHELSVLDVKGELALKCDADVLLIYHASGDELTCDDGQTQLIVRQGEMLLANSVLQLRTLFNTQIYAIRLWQRLKM